MLLKKEDPQKIAERFKKSDLLIFDFDGTLVEPLPVDWEEAWEKVKKTFLEYGVTFEDAHFSLGKLFAKAKKVEKRTAGKHASEDIMQRVSKILKRSELRITPQITPLLNLRSFFSAITERGFKTAIFSSNSRYLIMKFLKRERARSFVGLILGREDVQPPKPSPEGVYKICEHFGTDPTKCIFFGDNTVDMKAASRAGATGIGVLSGYGSEEELLEQGAYTIASIQDLYLEIKSENEEDIGEDTEDED